MNKKKWSKWFIVFLGIFFFPLTAINCFEFVREPVNTSVQSGKSVTKYNQKWKQVRAKVTAYTPRKESCGKYADGQTAIGDDAWVMDGVAADPSRIPYRTDLYIPGVGYREVDDTGAAMRNAEVLHIDLRMKSREKALEWGVQYMNIYIEQK